MLLVGALALIVPLVMLVVVMNGNYGGVLGEGPMKAVDEVAARQKTQRAELEQKAEEIRRFPEDISASQGTPPADAGGAASPATGGGAAAPETGGAAPGAGTEPPADAPAGN
jgi:hypothetical protein